MEDCHSSSAEDCAGQPGPSAAPPTGCGHRGPNHFHLRFCPPYPKCVPSALGRPGVQTCRPPREEPPHLTHQSTPPPVCTHTVPQNPVACLAYPTHFFGLRAFSQDLILLPLSWASATPRDTGAGVVAHLPTHPSSIQPGPGSPLSSFPELVVGLTEPVPRYLKSLQCQTKACCAKGQDLTAFSERGGDGLWGLWERSFTNINKTAL